MDTKDLQSHIKQDGVSEEDEGEETEKADE